jgi:hypothetical protein
MQIGSGEPGQDSESESLVSAPPNAVVRQERDGPTADEVLYPEERAEAETRAKQDQVGNDEHNPEGREYRLTLPDGAQLDSEMLAEAAPTFREFGLNDEQVSKLAPLGLRMVERAFDRQADEFEVVKAGWLKDTNADREIGGAALKETRRLAGVALEAGGADAEFRSLMNESGLGNHPSVLRVFRRLGATVEHARRSRGGGKPDRAQTLYPDDFKS